MKRLLRLAARLYPQSWRQRYGDEFDALLDDITPRWTDIVNVAGKAIRMRVSRSMLGLPVCCACIAMLGVWAFDAMRPAVYNANGVVAIQGAGPRDARWVNAVQTALAHENVPRLFDRDNHGVVLSRTGELHIWANDPNPRRAGDAARDLTSLLTSVALPPGQKLVVLRAAEVRGPGKLPMRVFGRYRSNQDVFGYAAATGTLFGLILGILRRTTRRTPLPV